MHRIIGFTGLIFLLCATVASGAENGLLARYTFDEGQGTVVGDSSGNGNNGTISGGVKFVPRGDGYALEFDGKTGKVDLGSPNNLVMKGDCTIEAWLKSSNSTNDDQLIFGDPADLSINRNILLVNSRGSLRVEYGDGGRSGYVMSEGIIFNGEWKHIAFVSEFPNYYLYINGQLAKYGALPFDMSPTKGMSRAIGGWWAGYFDGGIDDMRIYGRALSSSEIAADAGIAAPGGPKVDIVNSFTWATREVIVRANVDGLTSGNGKLRISILSPGVAAAQSKDVVLTETRPGSQRAEAAVRFKATGLKPGDYTIIAALVGQDGSVLAGARKEWKFGGVRSWLDSKAGVTDKVLAPWTPVTVKKEIAKGGQLKAANIGVWGRVYRFDGSLFPTQIEAKGKQLLSDPINVTARTNGRDFTFSKGTLKIEKSTPAYVILTSSSQAGGLALSVRYRIEYDGLIKFDWYIGSKTGANLESLRFEVPYKSEIGKYLYYCKYYGTPDGSTARVGELTEGEFVRPFNPFIWVGDDERGMQWVCESAANWYNTDKNKAVRVVKDAGNTFLRLYVVDKPTSIAAGKGLKYTFGLQASPVKPFENDCWDQRWASCTIVGYGNDYNLLTDKVDGMPVLDYYKQCGVKTILIMNWTDLLTYTDPVGQGNNLRNLVKECHKRGIKLIPYFGYQINEGIPEWADFGDDVVVKPLVRNPDRYPGMETQMVECVCLRSVWKDFLTDTIGKLIDNYDIDGIYLDSTVLPFPCMNEAHGCGYKDESGQLVPNYAVFDIRDTLKRLYTVVKSRKPDGLVEVHPYDGMHLPALSYATSYWTGEQLGAARDDDYMSALPLDRYRTDFMGVQWGIPAEFLHYKLGDYKKSFAFSLLHDVLVRPHAEGRESLDMVSGLWKLAEEFGRKQAEWLPYWKNSDYVHTGSSVVYCSLYKHPTNGVLAVVSNLDKQPQKVQLQFNLEKLGLNGGSLSATDGLTGEALSLDSGALSCDLPAVGWKMVWIKK